MELEAVPASEEEIKIECIRELESQIILKPSESEYLTQLLELSKEKDRSVKLEALQSLARVFIHFFDSGTLSTLKHSVASGGHLQKLLLDNYLIYRGKLMHDICYVTFPEVSQSSLHRIFLQLVCSEAAASGSLSTFLLGKFITRLLSNPKSPPILYYLFEKQLAFCDVTYCYLSILRGLVTPNLAGKYSHENILQVILIIQNHIPQKDEQRYLVPQKNTQKEIGHKDYSRLLSKVWLQFLSYELPGDVLIQVLRVMDSQVVPVMSDPRLLLDFLTSSLNAGGELSILSLKSLVILMHKHKLEYPHIYTKIYSLLRPEITHSEFFGDFLALFDLITTSTHLPQYVIASYVKRLARLTLRAPPHSTCPILVAMSNLLARHPNCSVMMHRPHREYPEGDPYSPTEQDPSKSNAIDSCLWELEPLKSHYSPQVCELVSKLFTPPLRGRERSLSQYLGSYQQSFEMLYKKSLDEINANQVRIKNPTRTHSTNEDTDLQ